MKKGSLENRHTRIHFLAKQKENLAFNGRWGCTRTNVREGAVTLFLVAERKNDVRRYSTLSANYKQTNIPSDEKSNQ